ncbi:hypothetical protein J8L88_03305 [Aquimarina sp. MMG015]|uniref:hypothetical protein n=1 Tax=Aquimarina TaxID=290174 RepID=UPI000429E8F5|nr:MULTISPECIES: hypothetical protein [Aquimarina]MBQ4801866.1 hypothetical protein [Aquimarina sp. MMG015]
MKKIIFIFLFLFASVSFSQEIDSLKVIEIPESYANYKGEPFIVKKDSLYLFRTPDVFLVNKKSFLAIKNVYQSTLQQDKMTKELIEKYSQTLRRNIDLERSLQINFAASDSLDQKVYEKTQATLLNTQKALDYTINSLERATNSLDIVDKAAKRQRRKGVFEKILIGVAGIGVGILVGVSL